MLDRFLSAGFKGREIVRDQLRDVVVVRRFKTDPSIDVMVSDDAPLVLAADGRPFTGAAPVELVAIDAGSGRRVFALLLIRDGQVYALDVYREDHPRSPSRRLHIRTHSGCTQPRTIPDAMLIAGWMHAPVQ